MSVRRWRPPKSVWSGSPATPCQYRRGNLPCAPLNHVYLRTSGELTPTAYSSCTCGRRFTPPDALIRKLRRYLALVGHDDAQGGLDAVEVASFIDGRWPESGTSRWGKTGVVPVSMPALHRSSLPIGDVNTKVMDF